MWSWYVGQLSLVMYLTSRLKSSQKTFMFVVWYQALPSKPTWTLCSPYFFHHFFHSLLTLLHSLLMPLHSMLVLLYLMLVLLHPMVMLLHPMLVFSVSETYLSLNLLKSFIFLWEDETTDNAFNTALASLVDLSKKDFATKIFIHRISA